MKLFKRNNKKLITAFGIIFVFAIITVFNFFNTSPKAALRKYLFTHGHPIVAVITPIKKHKLQEEIDKRYYGKDIQYSYPVYSLVIPIDNEIGDFIFDFVVNRNGESYEVKYYRT